MATLKQAQKNDAISTLKPLLTPGATVFTTVVNVARSGMSRHIRLFVMEDNAPRDISYLVGRILDYRVSDKTGGLIVSGCGMDMCYHTVYALSRALYPNGFTCTGVSVYNANVGIPRCCSNDHSNGDRDYTPHIHNDGGYALNKRDL
jgi:hypothetical protein